LADNFEQELENEAEEQSDSVSVVYTLSNINESKQKPLD